MNATAKLSLSLTAALALGAAVFACTTSVGTTSGIVDDTDGGSTTTTTPTKDSGTDAAVPVGEVCATTYQKTALVSADCQTCAEQKCCTTLKTCFNIAAADGGTETNCEDYSQCVASECAAVTDGGACGDTCDLVAAPGVVDAYGLLTECLKTNCSDSCAFNHH